MWYNMCGFTTEEWCVWYNTYGILDDVYYVYNKIRVVLLRRN